MQPHMQIALRMPLLSSLKLTNMLPLPDSPKDFWSYILTPKLLHKYAERTISIPELTLYDQARQRVAVGDSSASDLGFNIPSELLEICTPNWLKEKGDAIDVLAAPSC